MQADADIQVWLETIANTQPSVIVPHVQSRNAGPVRYRVKATKHGAGGRSVMSQSGTLRLEADVAREMGRLAFSRHPDDDCAIELVLEFSDGESKSYRFSCPD